MVVVNDANEDEADTSEEEELEQHDDSDAEGGVRLKFKSFMPEDLNNPTFKVGMSFPSIEMVRKAVTEYSLRQGMTRKGLVLIVQKDTHGISMLHMTAKQRLFW